MQTTSQQSAASGQRSILKKPDCQITSKLILKTGKVQGHQRDSHRKFTLKPSGKTLQQSNRKKETSPRFNREKQNREVVPLATDIELLREQGLKPKEVIVLQHLAAGHSLKAIEKHHPITHYYASNVLVRLRRRLGGISRDRLMYLVGSSDLLQETSSI